MTLNAKTLADAMALAIKQGPATPQMIGEATAIITELTVPATVMLPPGSVMGTAPSSGGPLTQGSSLPMGKILTMTPASLAAAFMANMGFPMITPQLLQMATGIVTHLMTGIVTFPPNTIVGVCSNTPVNPGNLTGLACTGGKISGLVGKSMADLIGPALGGPATPELVAKCQAICTHVMTSGVVIFAPGAVTAVCSAAGGPIAMGAGVGGKIT